MKKVVLLIILTVNCTLLTVNYLHAITTSGRLEVDETWSGNIRISGDVFIPAGITLSISPGTVINFTTNRSSYDHYIFRHMSGEVVNIAFDGKCDIIVEGTLRVEGKRRKMITIGNPSLDEDKISWGGIIFLGEGKDSFIKFSNIQYATIGIFCWDTSRPIINNNKISSNKFGVVAVDSSKPEITSNSIMGNKFGIGIYDLSAPRISGNKITKGEFVGVGSRDSSSPKLIDNFIGENDIGISCYDSSSPEIYKNKIIGNKLGIFSIDSAVPKIKGNLISKNKLAGIEIKNLSCPKISENKIEENKEGIKYWISSSPEMADNIFKGNKKKIVSSSKGAKITTFGRIDSDKIWSGHIYVIGDIIIPQGIKLTMRPGTKVTFSPKKSKYDYKVMRKIGDKPMNVTFDGKCDIIVEGQLIVDGKEEGIVEIGNPDFSGEEEGIGWGGIIFFGKNEVSRIENAKIKYGSIGIFLWDDSSCEILSSIISENKIGIDCSGSSRPRITKNEILKNFSHGIICVDSSSPLIESNKVEGNGLIGIGVKNNSIPKISKNEIRNNKFGIDIGGSSKPDVEENLITNNENGLDAGGFSSPNIKKNKFFGNRIAIKYSDSTKPYLKRNKFSENWKKIVDKR